VSFKGEVITIDGMKDLFVKKMNGEKLPSNYKELAENYMKWKTIQMEDHKSCCSDCSVKKQFEEAVAIARFLCEE